MLFPTQNHPSRFHDLRYVYPVVSRRAGGVSIGVNLSPSKRCTFGCVYCQVHVDRTREAEELKRISPTIDLAVLDAELRRTVETVRSGAIFREDRFAATPSEKRFLRDFAFSGDGEPTLSPQFAEAAALLTDVRRDLSLHELKLVLITNATFLQNEATVRGCDALAANNGEIWAKLDAGSPEHYRRMNRSDVPFETILDNISFAARRWPTVIQTMLLAEESSVPPSDREIDDYCRAVKRILSGGGSIRKLQLYTVARAPFENNVSALDNATMESLAGKIAEKTSLPTEVFFSR